METAKRMIRLRVALVAVIAMVAVLLVAPRADATGVDVTTGHFETTAAGQELGYDIEGFAIMLRVPKCADGRTYVSVFVRGLDANTTFSAHVHNGTCASGGGGHYQHESGPVDAVNEIWPTITTQRRGLGWGSASHGHWARPEAQSVVIHQPGTGTRLACAQLR
ncbi:MAG: hypothetical protein M5U23_10225 [Acidimicrobiia bacterium]|nr:hypothetical protein [Acidimicrobiia bacterium]